jgi:pyruvate kinase
MKKRTKIVCTIGPASWTPEVMTEMVAKGMNVARVNGAFADVAELKRVEGVVRGVSNDVALMLDIKGTEVRLNKFGDPFEVKTGEIMEIGNSEEYKIFPRTYPGLIHDLKEGDELIFDDGNLVAVLKEKKGEVMVIEFTKGGTFKEGKSINTPGIMLKNPPLTETDKEQVAYCKAAGWEFVAASFIRTREDAELVVAQVAGSTMKVIAKIEDGHGVENIDDILEVVHGVMVARGDLGVEVPYEKIPMIQKELIMKSNMAGKPVITATQMLESMVNNDRPTRAEITDVANAIIDGTDAIMLSAESSAGKYPVQSVDAMRRIAEEVEGQMDPEIVFGVSTGDAVADALARAAFQVATDLSDRIKAIVSVSGSISRILATFSLEQPVYPFIEDEVYRRQLVALTRGIDRAFVLKEKFHDRDSAVGMVIGELKDAGLVHDGDEVLVIGYAVSTPNDFPNIFEIVKVA